MVKQQIEDTIRSDFGKDKVVLMLGARQVGKTTLLVQLSEGAQRPILLNCNNADDRETLSASTTPGLSTFVANADFLLIDEAQHAKNIGLTLKMLADTAKNEASYGELVAMVGVNKATVEFYIDLLEKTFVVFRLPSRSRNVRNEIRKGRKIYFWDNGIRDAVIGNFAHLALRLDVGATGENYLVSERHKFLACSRSPARSHFWRTTVKNKINYVEECASWHCISRGNYVEFVTGQV